MIYALNVQHFCHIHSLFSNFVQIHYFHKRSTLLLKHLRVGRFLKASLLDQTLSFPLQHKATTITRPALRLVVVNVLERLHLGAQRTMQRGGGGYPRGAVH